MGRITLALHSTPGERFVYMSGVIGPARVSAGVGQRNFGAYPEFK
jgi:hypothetical protein